MKNPMEMLKQNQSRKDSQETDPVKEKTPEAMLELVSKIVDEAEKIEIKQSDKNEKGELLVSPDGPVSNLGKESELWWRIARTESFKAFFGDWQNGKASKIVDKNGEPLVLFRGTRKAISISDFYNEDFYKEKSIAIMDQPKGVFFSPLPESAFGYSVHGTTRTEYGSVVSAFVNARNVRNSNSLAQELDHKRRKILLKIPNKLLKFIPKLSIFNFDSVIYTHSNPKEVDEASEISINSPYQVLIIPNSVIKPKYKKYSYKYE